MAIRTLEKGKRIAMGALPVAESSDLSNGQRSARSELAESSEDSAGYRNPDFPRRKAARNDRRAILRNRPYEMVIGLL